MRRSEAFTRTPAGRLGTSRARRWTALAAAIPLLLILGTAWVARPFDPVRVEVVREGLEHPWDIAFADDGRMLVTERIGRVRVYASGKPGAALLSTAVVPHVRAELESGLMGIAVHGDDVVTCATRGIGDEPWDVDLLRASLAADGTLSPFVALPIGEATGGPRHQGCAVEIDAAAHVWVSIGDANQPAGSNRAQDPRWLNGKVLRVALDGTPVAGNPSGGRVFSLGHRNPQGIAMNADGLVLAVEHGTDENDEINILEPGGNYGYPCYTGADAPGPIPDGCGKADIYRAPAWASRRPTLATSGAEFLIGDGWGDWEGDLVVTTLKEEDVRRFSVNADGSVTFLQTLLDDRFGRLRAAEVGPDGALYVSTANGDGDRILRITR
jgi:glucose/arabinose dehydrogenase